EAGDVDESDHVRRVLPEGGDDLAAVRVPGDDRGAILPGEHLTEPGHVVGKRGEWELRRGDREAVLLEVLDDGAPARSVGPGSVHEHDVQRGIHCGPPSWRLRAAGEAARKPPP